MTRLVAIGTLEARESARELAEVSRTPRPSPNGAGFTALGSLASAGVFVGLGAWLAICAGLVSDAVRDAVARYAEVPEWLVPLVLALFVGLCAAVTAAGGAALALAGVRLSRAASRRPPA